MRPLPASLTTAIVTLPADAAAARWFCARPALHPPAERRINREIPSSSLPAGLRDESQERINARLCGEALTQVDKEGLRCDAKRQSRGKERWRVVEPAAGAQDSWSTYVKGADRGKGNGGQRHSDLVCQLRFTASKPVEIGRIVICMLGEQRGGVYRDHSGSREPVRQGQHGPLESSLP